MTSLAIFILYVLAIIIFIRQHDIKQEIEKQKQRSKQLSDKIKLLTQGKPETLNLPKEQRIISPQLDEEIKIQKNIDIIKDSAIKKTSTEEDVSELSKTKSIDNIKEIPKSLSPKSKFQLSENWMGVNLLNRLGILLILIGAIAVTYYEGFPAILRASVLFIVSVLVVCFGEWLNRKVQTIFSLGISAGGIALLYVTLAVSYFGLNVVNMQAALIICVVMTILAFSLAIRYKAQVISSFALVGGYLPIFSLNIYNSSILYVMMIYFLILNFFTISLSFKNKWSVTNALSLLGTICVTPYLGYRITPEIGIVYAIFTLFMHTAIPLIGAYRTKEKFNFTDKLLITINTFASSIIIFSIADNLPITNIYAYLCIAFALLYFGLAILISRVFNEKDVCVIFKLVSIGFTVIFVPFYFKEDMFLFAWLVEGTLMAIYGILHSRKLPEYSAMILLILCALILIIYNYFNDYNYTLKFAFFTIGLLAVLVSYLLKKRNDTIANIFKILALINLWIFFNYLILKHLDNNNKYLLCCLITFILGFAYAHLPILSTRSTQILSIVMHIMAKIELLLISSTDSSGIFLNFLAHLIAMIAIYDCINLVGKDMKIVLRTFLLLGYFVLVVTQGLIVRGDIAFNNAIISILYALTALIWIIIGFKIKNKSVRKFGLVVSMASVAKLLVIDTMELSTGTRIISYISLGMLLILISWIYSKLSKKLE